MLAPELLLTAYRNGIFPMAVNERGDIGWFSPDPRGIIPLDDRFHVPHGLMRVLKTKCEPPLLEGSAPSEPRAGGAPSKDRFHVTFDTEFENVMCECSKRKGGTWISTDIIKGYCELHRLGHAHSVETRLDGKLAGGLYGVHIGGAFFGESMFHRATDASKVALVALVQRLRERGFALLDTQWQTEHLAQFGTIEIPKSEYLRLLKRALAVDCGF